MMSAAKFSLFRDHNYNSEVLNSIYSIFEFIQKIVGIFMVLVCHNNKIENNPVTVKNRYCLANS